jgi:hypothetical protein
MPWPGLPIVVIWQADMKTALVVNQVGTLNGNP